MLALLHIENIALIDRADITFGPGFNVLTGETGAGKSIIIDAIGAVLGERTSRDLIRSGEKAALVTALFRDLPHLPWFDENGVGPDENGELLISRKIQGDGKNLCRVGGVPCTVVQLKALGSQLIDIHGQHDGQQLLDETCHLGYLDSFGDLGQALADYQAEYAALDQLRRQTAALQMDEGEKARKMDTLQFQIGELGRANLRPGEEEELEERRTLLRSADKLMAAVEGAYNALFGTDSQDGAASLLAQAEGELSRVAEVSGELGRLSAALSDLRYAAEDAADGLREFRDSLEVSPGQLDQVEDRLDQLHRLKKKYGSTVQEMLDYLDHCRQELDRIELADDTLAKLKQQRRAQLAKTREKGEILSQLRRQAAEKLKARIEEELRQLDMPRAQFQCVFTETPLTPTGADGVAFAMSANVGEAMKPLNKVASGGELARIMLALKNVLAQQDQVDTLIFDEVDTGVSGRAAQKVAEKLRSVAKTKQVLCVTHLPQIAALADTHLRIAKGERDGRTYTTVTPLDWSGRQQELARIIGGAEITQTTLDSAGEMLLAGGIKPPEA